MFTLQQNTHLPVLQLNPKQVDGALSKTQVPTASGITLEMHRQAALPIM